MAKPQKTYEFGYVFKVEFPNKKIYIGYDVNRMAPYCGGRLDDELFQLLRKSKSKDPEKRQIFSIEKEILHEVKDVTEGEMARLRNDYILRYCSNNPEIGYNKNPPFKPDNKH